MRARAKNQNGSRRDRIDEFIEKGRFKQAIPMLESLLKTHPSDTARRKLAKCLFETGAYFHLFEVLNAINEPKPADEQLRREGLERLIGPRAETSPDGVEPLAELAVDLAARGNPLDAARIALRLTNTWLERLRANQARPGESPAFRAMVHDPRQDLGLFDSLEPGGGAKILLCRAWYLRHDAGEQNASRALGEAESLLSSIREAWKDPLVWRELAQVRLARRDWGGAARAYHGSLLRAAAQPGQPFHPLPQDVLPSLPAGEARRSASAVIEALLELLDGPGTEPLPVEAEACPRCVETYPPALALFAAALENSPDRAAMGRFFAALPDWVITRFDVTLACRWIDWKIAAAPRETDMLERVARSLRTRYPEFGPLAYRLAQVYYLQSHSALALHAVEEAVRLHPERKRYTDFRARMEHIELVSGRRPAEKFACLTEAERACLLVLDGTGNFPDLDVFAAACKLPRAEALAMILDFAAMKVLFPDDREDPVIWRSTKLVHVGEWVYRIPEDVATQIERSRGPRYYFPAPPGEHAPEPPLTASLFVTGEERRVYAALASIFLTGSLRGEFMVSANIPMQYLFAKEARALIDPDDLGYFQSTSVDFCVARKDGSPVLAVEVDGITHREERRREDDRWKNDLFQRAGLPLLRISSPESDVISIIRSLRECLGNYLLLPEDILRGAGPGG